MISNHIDKFDNSAMQSSSKSKAHISIQTFPAERCLWFSWFVMCFSLNINCNAYALFSLPNSILFPKVFRNKNPKSLAENLNRCEELDPELRWSVHTEMKYWIFAAEE